MFSKSLWRSALLAPVVALLVIAGLTPASAAERSGGVGDDFYSVAADGYLDVRAPGLIANDAEPGPAKLWLVSAHTQGIVTLPSDGEGAFSFQPKIGQVGFDSFTYCLKEAGATSCSSDTATVIIKVGAPTVTRVAGADRYEGAANVAQKTNPTRSGFVFVTSGENFPDALSVAPAASKFDVAMLLVRKGGVPEATKRELARLHPSEIIVVGGPASVPESVLGELGGLLAPGAMVSRISGADRYEVSRTIAARMFAESGHSYTATGVNFPDALAAGAVAGAKDEPVVLLDGGASAVDAATQATFLNLGTSKITIVGGANSVSRGVESTLDGISTVVRIDGVDRYEAAVTLARSAVPSATVAYLATGATFPDALVGGVWAAQTGSPVYLAKQDCVPTAVLADIARIGASEVRLLGGTNSLSVRVERLEHC